MEMPKLIQMKAEKEQQQKRWYRKKEGKEDNG
jgi:hypothetical protein